MNVAMATNNFTMKKRVDNEGNTDARYSTNLTTMPPAMIAP